MRSSGATQVLAVAPASPPQLNNHFTEMCCGTEAGLYLRLIDSCFTELKAQGPSRTCNESKEEALAIKMTMYPDP